MSVYEQHDKAFNNTNAYVLAHVTPHGVGRIATIAFIRGKTGNVRCFFHHIGYPMQVGNAGGYGYDKFSDAFYIAVNKHYEQLTGTNQASSDFIVAEKIKDAAKEGYGASNWDRALQNAGFHLLQAI